MDQFTLKVNGNTHHVSAAADTPLLWVLRDHLNLVGTKYGCGIGECGACTIHVDGVATKSCLLTIAAVGNSDITTIEGLSEKGNHPVQEAWIEHDVAQCGYCQSGQIMSAASLLSKNPHPDDSIIESAMNGNICRCGTYIRIKSAIKTAASKG